MSTAAVVAKRVVVRWEALLVVLILAAGVWSWTLSSFFLRRANLLDLATPYIFIGLAAFGLTFVVVAGEIDISVMSIMAVAAVSIAEIIRSPSSDDRANSMSASPTSIPSPFAVRGMGLS